MSLRSWIGKKFPLSPRETRTRWSLHRSLQIAFWTFGGVLVVLYAGLAHMFSFWQEDRLLIRQVELEFESYLQEHPTVLAGAPPPPVASRFFSVHLGTASLPPELRQEAAELPPGIHGIEKNPTHGEDFLLVIRETEQPDRRLYMAYDLRRFDDYEQWDLEILKFLFPGAIVFAIGLIWASRYSRSVLDPLTRLAKTVAGEQRPVHLAKALAASHDPTEVAILSKSIEQSMRTIDEFIQREREFTRNASHELRTPLAVIRGAVELLRFESLSDPAVSRLRRVERSIQQMEELIETFLWLARSHPGPADGVIEVKPIIERVVESHRHLLGDRAVDVVVDVEPSLRVAAREHILAVVIANLVKNAFYSIQDGSVRIHGSEHGLSVADTGPGMHSELEDHDSERSIRGFGLPIVRELCEHSGWSLELADCEPHGTVATIDFTRPQPRWLEPSVLVSLTVPRA